jgi:hypothetical protein
MYMADGFRLFALLIPVVMFLLAVLVLYLVIRRAVRDGIRDARNDAPPGPPRPGGWG